MSRAVAKKKPDVAVAAVPDARADLARAIEAKREADLAVTAQEQAVERAAELVDQADAAVEAARGKVAGADEADTKRAATSIRTTAEIISPWSGDRARQAVSAAEEHRAIAQRALERLRADLLVLQDDAADRAVDVLVAVKLVVLPVANELHQRLTERKREVAILGRVLSELVGDDERTAPKFHDARRSIQADSRRGAPLRELSDQVRHLLLVGADDAAHQAAATALAQWKAVLAALRVDANALLPSAVP
jgi:hypothetical protein